jgi:hypothetical protein
MAGTGRWSSQCGLAMARRQRPGHGAVRAVVDRPAFKGEHGGGEGVPLRSKAAGRGMGSAMATVWRQRHRSGGAVAAARPVHGRRVAPGDWGREAVRRKWGRGPRHAGTGGPKPASACSTAAHVRPAWPPRRDTVRAGARSRAGSTGPIPLRPVQRRISPNVSTEVG